MQFAAIASRIIITVDAIMRALPILLFAALLGLATTAQAQELVIPPVSFPALAEHGQVAKDFVPAGWLLERAIAGDLNKDGADDLLLLLHQNDPANILTHDGMGESPFDSNPRMLAVVFGDGQGGYRLGFENHSFIARREDPVMSDPMSEAGELSIARGSIVATLYFFMSAGGSDTSSPTFRFRYQEGDFHLIGYDGVNTNRMSGKTHDVSINYLTSKAVIKTGSIETDVVETTTKRLRPQPLLTMEDVGDGLSFEPEY